MFVLDVPAPGAALSKAKIAELTLVRGWAMTLDVMHERAIMRERCCAFNALVRLGSRVDVHMLFEMAPLESSMSTGSTDKSRTTHIRSVRV